MQKRSWRFRGFVGGIMLLLIPVGVIGVSSAVGSVTGDAEQTLVQTTQMAGALAQEVQTALERETRLLAGIARQGRGLREAATGVGTLAEHTATARAQGYLAETAIQWKGHYEGLTLLDARGRVVAVQGTSAAGLDAASPAFLMARNGLVGVGNPFRSEQSGETVVQICAPLYDARGAFAGALGGTVRVGALIHQVGHLRAGKSGYALLIDGSGRIVTPLPRTASLPAHAAGVGLPQLALTRASQQDSQAFSTDPEAERLIAFAPVPAAGWSVGFTQTRDELAAVAQTQGYLKNGLAGLVLALALVALAGTLRRPASREALREWLGVAAGGHPTPSRTI